MNINNLTNGLGGSSKTRDAEKPSADQAPKNTESAQSSGDDKVHLSAQSKSIQQIESEVASLPDIDEATISRIQNALANNEYNIDYEQLAGKIINFESNLN